MELKITNGWIEHPNHVYILLFAVSGFPSYTLISIFNFDFIFLGSYRPGNTHVFVPLGWCYGITPGELRIRFLGFLFTLKGLI